MISKIIHILLSLPRPSEEYFDKIENVFLKFLWQDKPPKFKTSTLENLTTNEGSVYYVYTNSTIRSLEHVLAMPIWYSTKIITVKMQSWVDKGIQTIGDMLDTEGHIYSLEYFKNILHLTCDFLTYNRLKKIQITIGNNQISPQDNLRPRLPFILYNIEIGTKGNKNTYFNFQTKGYNTLV